MLYHCLEEEDSISIEIEEPENFHNQLDSFDISYIGAVTREAYFGSHHLQPRDLLNTLQEMMNILSGHGSSRKIRNKAKYENAKKIIELCTNTKVEDRILDEESPAENQRRKDKDPSYIE